MSFPHWHARGSALGGYNACMFRAYLDHALQTGRIAPASMGFSSAKDANQSSPPADFGTCCHWTAQTCARCCFKLDKSWNDMAFTGWDEVTAVAEMYDDKQWANGASMFSSEQVALGVMHSVAGQVVERLPQGREWMAEACFELPGLLNGHIDFLSSDLNDIVDLKTTGAKPTSGKPKVAHLWQLIGYALGVLNATGVLPERGWIIYAHNRGDWCFRTHPLEFHKPVIMAMVMKLATRLGIYADFARLNDLAIPNPGPACEDFCPYTRCCRDDIIPSGIAVRDRVTEPLDSESPFQGL